MNSCKTIIHDREYLKLQIIPIVQKNCEFFITKIEHKDLLKIYTVEPTKYDIALYGDLKDTSSDLAQYYEMIVQKDDEDIQTQGFQRVEEEDRVYDIKKFILSDDFPVFPNSVIVTCDLGIDISDVESGVPVEEYMRDSNNSKLSFIEKNDGNTYIYVPFESNSLIIVDGQHRVAGLREANILDKYELIISIIVGYDRTYISSLFYTINYYQKKVNKSVLLHLQAEFSRKLDQVTFIHGIVRILNEHRQSSLNGRIKMLGITPKNATDVEKANYGVSQAFLVDYMLPLIGKEPSRSLYQPVFYYYYKNKDYHGDLVKFILMYFNAIRRHTSHYWANTKDSIITKTISIGAFIKVLHLIYVKIFIDEWNCNADGIKSITTDHLEILLNGIEDIDFSKSGTFGGVSSAGSLGKLQKHIVSKMEYFGKNDYEVVVDDFRRNYLPKYKEWYNSVKRSC